jgi:hypothetical protein
MAGVDSATAREMTGSDFVRAMTRFVIPREVAGSTRNEVWNDTGGTSVNPAAPRTF